MKRTLGTVLGLTLQLFVLLSWHQLPAQGGPVGEDPHAACDRCREEGIHVTVSHAGGCSYLFVLEHGLGCPVTQVNWYFGDGQSVTGGNSNSVLHTYAPGSYFVYVDIVVGTLPDTCHISRYTQVNATGCIPENCGPCQIWQPGKLFVTSLANPCTRRFDVVPGYASPACPNVSYSINFGDGMSLLNQSSISNLNHTFPGNGTYNVCVTETRTVGGYSCSTTYCQSVKITNCLVCAPCPITNPANLNVYFAPFNPCRVAVTASPFNGCGDIDYLVDFGDGSPVVPFTGLAVQHVYSVPGPVTITLTEVHFDGVNSCSSTRTYSHIVPKDCERAEMRESQGSWELVQVDDVALRVVPNALKPGGYLTVSWAESQDVRELQLLDLQGREVWRMPVTGTRQQEVQLPVSISRGLYFLAADGGKNGIGKVMVE